MTPWSDQSLLSNLTIMAISSSKADHVGLGARRRSQAEGPRDRSCNADRAATHLAWRADARCNRTGGCDALLAMTIDVDPSVKARP